jgi:hypothetical protein
VTAHLAQTISNPADAVFGRLGEIPGMPPPPDPRPFLSRSTTVLAETRRRLGTALQDMAADLAKERWRNRELERELARFRPRSDPERRGPR